MKSQNSSQPFADHSHKSIKTVKPSFSIVIPVFNVREYIYDAVSSIKNQSFSDFECIIVDDGSVDGSIDRIAKLIKGDERFVCKKQKNSGLSSARNSGFKFATGEYVVFLDSDDVFELNMLEEIHEKAMRTKADVVVFNHTILDDITGHKSLPIHDFSPLMNKEWITARSINNIIFNIFGNQVWTKAFKRDLLVRNGLSFNEQLKRAEDIPFTNSALLLAQRIAVVDKGLVAYRMNRGDSNSDRLAAHHKAIFESLDELYNLLLSLGVVDTFITSFQNLFMENMYYNLNSLVGTDKLEDEFKLAKKYAKKYQIINKPDSYLYSQLFDVSDIIFNKELLDMLVYIVKDDKASLRDKQTLIYAKDDVITQKDIEITDINRHIELLSAKYDAIKQKYNRITSIPIIRVSLMLRRQVQKIAKRHRPRS